MITDLPQSLIEAVRYFSDLAICNKYMQAIKWPDGKIVCPKCESERIGQIATRHMLRCKDCRKQFSAKVGTLFEDSPLGLDKWFVAVWCISNSKNGISSHELGRALDVTQKTAWFMLHRIREAMKTGSFRKLEGEVETDETFIGGKARNMHKAKREAKIKGRGTVSKTIVHGLLERGGEARMSVVRDTEGATLQPLVHQNVERGSAVYSDAMPSYRGLDGAYGHQFIDHASKYVEGRVHTNGLENFWSLLKRTLAGTYVSVRPFHLTRYLDEQAFRFNRRLGSDASRFYEVLSAVVGKRLTYRVLTAQGDAGFMGIR
jgi:transposase-like protein